jgi:hypothetical protein
MERRAERYAEGKARRCAFIAGLCVATVALVPGFVLTFSWSSWRQPLLLAGIGVLSASTVLGEIRLKRVMFYAPYDALTTLALVIGGPLAALLRYLLADVPSRLITRRLPVASVGAWATYVSYGYAALAGSALLHAASVRGIHDAAVPAVTAGLVAVSVNWLIASGLFRKFWSARSFIALAREELLGVLPSVLGQQALAAIVVILVPLLGAGVLALLCLTTLLPALGLPALVRSRDITQVDRTTVTRVYALALAAHLRLTRSQRRTISAAATLSSRPEEPGLTTAAVAVRPGLLRGPLPPAPTGISSDPALAWKAWHVVRQASERWDGTDGDEGTPRGRLLPVEARVLAVAREWAKLTAAGGLGLPQRQAVLALEAQAGTRFDPRVVEAVGEIVTVEERFASLETFQPRLDLLPLPEVVRRELLPWALQAYS